MSSSGRWSGGRRGCQTPNDGIRGAPRLDRRSDDGGGRGNAHCSNDNHVEKTESKAPMAPNADGLLSAGVPADVDSHRIPKRRRAKKTWIKSNAPSGTVEPQAGIVGQIADLPKDRNDVSSSKDTPRPNSPTALNGSTSQDVRRCAEIPCDKKPQRHRGKNAWMRNSVPADKVEPQAGTDSHSGDRSWDRARNDVVSSKDAPQPNAPRASNGNSSRNDGTSTEFRDKKPRQRLPKKAVLMRSDPPPGNVDAQPVAVAQCYTVWSCGRTRNGVNSPPSKDVSPQSSSSAAPNGNCSRADGTSTDVQDKKPRRRRPKKAAWIKSSAPHGKVEAQAGIVAQCADWSRRRGRNRPDFPDSNPVYDAEQRNLREYVSSVFRSCSTFAPPAEAIYEAQCALLHCDQEMPYESYVHRRSLDAAELTNESGLWCKSAENEEEKGDESVDQEYLDFLTASVYHNDLIMSNIIGFVCDMSDRCRLELSSNRLHALSKKTPYKFAKGGDTLSIFFSTLDDWATVQLGSFVRHVPVLTFETKRFDNMPSEMTPAFKDLLDGISTRFRRQVKKMSIGGTPSFYASRGVADHQLIMTRDLLEALVGGAFPSITSVRFEKCGFEAEAVEYCSSDAFKEFASRLTDVQMCSMWAEERAQSAIVAAALIGPSVTKISMSMFTTKLLGAALLRSLALIGHVEELELEINEGTAADNAELFTMLKGAAGFTEQLRVHINPCGDSSYPPNISFELLEKIHLLTNVTELRVRIKPDSRQHFESLIALCQNLPTLSRLRCLQLNGFRDAHFITNDRIRALADALYHSVHGLPALEDLTLANFPQPLRFVIQQWGERERAFHNLAWAIASCLPPSLKRIELRSTNLTDEMMMEIYTACPLLESIKLVDTRRLSAKAIVPLLTGAFPAMRSIDAEIPITLPVAWNLADVEATPQLVFGRFGVKTRIGESDSFMEELQKQFDLAIVNAEAPRGAVKSFFEVHRRQRGAVTPSRRFIDDRKKEAEKDEKRKRQAEAQRIARRQKDRLVWDDSW